MNKRIPMDIQMFAEDGVEETVETVETVETEAAEAGEAGRAEQPKELSFDDFLKTGSNQAEFDRRLQKGIDTAVKKAQAKWKLLQDEEASEAEKLAKMNAAEKAEYQQSQRARELDKREQELAKREMMATAKMSLADRGLSADLASFLDYSSAEACNDSIAKLEAAVKAQTEAAMKDRLKGGKPPKQAPQENDQKDQLKKTIENAVRNGFY